MEVNSPQVWIVPQIVVDDTLGLVIQQCVLNQSQGSWFYFYALIVTISLVCQMQVDYLTLNISEIQVSCPKIMHAKKVVQVLNLFISFKISFQTCKVHNVLAMMLDPHYKGLSLSFNMLARSELFELSVSMTYR
jgi:hypothetical protein